MSVFLRATKLRVPRPCVLRKGGNDAAGPRRFDLKRNLSQPTFTWRPAHALTSLKSPPRWVPRPFDFAQGTLAQVCERRVADCQQRLCGAIQTYPPLRKTQGRGTHTFQTGRKNEIWATRPRTRFIINILLCIEIATSCR